ncbi:hypothetical protein MRB53_039476 [Persea americana]|nr:hypothetical protein MRB53_039476 [Persea americana]
MQCDRLNDRPRSFVAQIPHSIVKKRAGPPLMLAASLRRDWKWDDTQLRTCGDQEGTRSAQSDVGNVRSNTLWERSQPSFGILEVTRIPGLSGIEMTHGGHSIYESLASTRDLHVEEASRFVRKTSDQMKPAARLHATLPTAHYSQGQFEGDAQSAIGASILPSPCHSKHDVGRLLGHIEIRTHAGSVRTPTTISLPGHPFSDYTAMRVVEGLSDAVRSSSSCICTEVAGLRQDSF